MSNHYLDQFTNAHQFSIHACSQEFANRRGINGEAIPWLYNYGYSPMPHAWRRCIGVSPTEKLVLEELFASMKWENIAKVTHKELAAKLDMDKDTVAANLRKLAEKGFIVIEQYQGKTIYHPYPFDRHPYIFLSELTHFAKEKFVTKNVSKLLCFSGVVGTMTKVTKSAAYTEFLHKLRGCTFQQWEEVRQDYFQHLISEVKTANGISILIPTEKS